MSLDPRRASISQRVVLVAVWGAAMTALAMLCHVQARGVFPGHGFPAGPQTELVLGVILALICGCELPRQSHLIQLTALVLSIGLYSWSYSPSEASRESYVLQCLSADIAPRLAIGSLVVMFLRKRHTALRMTLAVAVWLAWDAIIRTLWSSTLHYPVYRGLWASLEQVAAALVMVPPSVILVDPSQLELETASGSLRLVHVALKLCRCVIAIGVMVLFLVTRSNESTETPDPFSDRKLINWRAQAEKTQAQIQAAEAAGDQAGATRAKASYLKLQRRISSHQRGSTNAHEPSASTWNGLLRGSSGGEGRGEGHQ